MISDTCIKLENGENYGAVVLVLLSFSYPSRITMMKSKEV